MIEEQDSFEKKKLFNEISQKLTPFEKQHKAI